MENREAIIKEALLNKALEAEFSDGMRHEILIKVAEDFLRDKLFYLGCVKIFEEAGDNVTAENFKLRAKLVDEKYLEPLSKIVGEIKLSTWHMKEEDLKEIKKYFGNEYLDYGDE